MSPPFHQATDYVLSAKTSLTPKSAMTSLTHSQFAKTREATEGARRATGVASCVLAGRRSRRAVLILSDRCTIDANPQLLLLNIYRGNCIFICGLRGHLELLTKDIQDQVTSDEPHQVIATGGRLRQRVFGSLDRFRKPDGVPTLIKRSLGRLSPKLAVPVTSIVFLLKYQRLFSQVFFSLHCHPAKKTTSVVIVKLFNDAVPPRLSHRNKPGFDSVEQTQPDQIAHSSWVLTAAKENRLVVYLLMVRYAQTAPTRPDSVYGVLTSLVDNRIDRTPPSCQIDAVQAVKPYRPIQITWTHIVRLMNLVHLISHQCRVLLSLWFVRSCSSVRQLFSTQYPVYRSQRRYLLDAQFFKLPLNGLSSAKQPVVIKTEPNHLYRFNYFLAQLTWVAPRTRRAALEPVRRVIAALVTFDPLVNPLSRVTQRSSDAGDLFTFQVTTNRKSPIALFFSF